MKSEEARYRLEAHFDYPGVTPVVYTLCTSIARSGMSREYKVFSLRGNDIVDLSVEVGRFLEWHVDKDFRTVRVRGVGLDLGKHLVYTLSAGLYGYQDKGGLHLQHVAL